MISSTNLDQVPPEQFRAMAERGMQLLFLVDATGKKIVGRHDFKGTTAKVELNEKDKVITLGSVSVTVRRE